MGGRVRAWMMPERQCLRCRNISSASLDDEALSRSFVPGVNALIGMSQDCFFTLTFMCAYVKDEEEEESLDRAADRPHLS